MPLTHLLTGMDEREAKAFERQAIVAALFQLCDPLRTMENLNKGDTVQLKSGGPVMTIAGQATSSGPSLICHWFNGSELKQGVFLPEELRKVEPREPEDPPTSRGIRSY